jgi:hypothetical protein
MKSVKILFVPLIFAGMVLFSSCKEETRQDIGEKLDTAVQKIGEGVDTLAQKLSDIGVDSIFKDVKVTEVDTSGLAAESFRSKLNEVFNDYEDLKEALAENDTSDAVMQSNQLKKSLENVMDEDLSENQKTSWAKNKTNLEKSASEIASATTIANQRKSFAGLTNEMLNVIKAFGLHDKTIYHLECPGMGGGSWLTDSRTTDNPYGGTPATETAAKTGDTTATDKDIKKECASVKEAWEFD